MHPLVSTRNGGATGQGAEAALQSLARRFGAHLPQRLPRLWEAMTGALAADGDAQARRSRSGGNWCMQCGAPGLSRPLHQSCSRGERGAHLHACNALFMPR